MFELSDREFAELWPGLERLLNNTGPRGLGSRRFSDLILSQDPCERAWDDFSGVTEWRRHPRRAPGWPSALSGPVFAPGGHLQYRLLAFDGESVTFRWKDYARGNKKRKMTVIADEFLRRFLLHSLPRGFVRIRFFVFLDGPHLSRMLRSGR